MIGTDAGRIRVAAMLAGLALLACAGSADRASEAAIKKIHLDLAAINADGLAGQPDGLHAVSYEFCIPATETAASEVKAIDRTVEVMRGAHGRIGCRDDQWLCLGHTHQPGFRDVLVKLAGLDYVDAIEPFHGE